MLKIASEARDRFGATVCVGVAAMLFWHVAINVGMVSGMLPGRRRDAAPHQLRRLQHPDDAAALGLVMNVSVRRFAY